MNINYFDDENKPQFDSKLTLKEANKIYPSQQKAYDKLVNTINTTETMKADIPKSLPTTSLNNAAASLVNSPKTPTPTLTKPAQASPVVTKKPSGPVMFRKEAPSSPVSMKLATNQETPISKSEFNGKGMFRSETPFIDPFKMPKSQPAHRMDQAALGPVKTKADKPFIDPFKTPDKSREPDPTKAKTRDFEALQKQVDNYNKPKRDVEAEFLAARGDKPAPNVPYAKMGRPGRDVGREFDELRNPGKYDGIPSPVITKKPADASKEVPKAVVQPKPAPAPSPAPEAPKTMGERLASLGEKLPKTKEDLKALGQKASDFAKTPAGNALAGGAAAVLAMKLISDALKKKEWYNEKCQGISNARKKAECLNYVSTRMRSDLKKKLKRCKHSNNPSKCESIIMDKLNSM